MKENKKSLRWKSILAVVAAGALLIGVGAGAVVLLNSGLHFPAANNPTVPSHVIQNPTDTPTVPTEEATEPPKQVASLPVNALTYWEGVEKVADDAGFQLTDIFILISDFELQYIDSECHSVYALQIAAADKYYNYEVDITNGKVMCLEKSDEGSFSQTRYTESTRSIQLALEHIGRPLENFNLIYAEKITIDGSSAYTVYLTDDSTDYTLTVNIETGEIVSKTEAPYKGLTIHSLEEALTAASEALQIPIEEMQDLESSVEDGTVYHPSDPLSRVVYCIRFFYQGFEFEVDVDILYLSISTMIIDPDSSDNSQGSMEPDPDIQTGFILELANWPNIKDVDSYHIDYYGKYNQAYIFAVRYWYDIIYDVPYDDLLVYHEDKIYSLKEAYTIGILQFRDMCELYIYWSPRIQHALKKEIEAEFRKAYPEESALKRLWISCYYRYNDVHIVTVTPHSKYAGDSGFVYVGPYRIYYQRRQPMVYYEKKFYTLNDAYELGLLDDITLSKFEHRLRIAFYYKYREQDKK